jgi:hypothetical protein
MRPQGAIRLAGPLTISLGMPLRNPVLHGTGLALPSRTIALGSKLGFKN